LSATTIESQKEESQKITTLVEEKLSEVQNKLETLNRVYQDKISEKTTEFQQTSDNLKTSIIEKTEELKKSARDTLEEQKSENLKTLNQILETHNNIKQLIGQLLDLKIPEILKNINENLEKSNKTLADFRKEVTNIETNNQERFKTTKTLQIGNLIAVGIIGIIVILKLFGAI
jgi:hypothetical protein